MELECPRILLDSEKVSRVGTHSGHASYPKAESSEHLSKEMMEKMEMVQKGIAPESGRTFADIEIEVFGIARNSNPNLRSPRKLLRRALLGPRVLDWYIPSLFQSPLAEQKLNPIQVRRRQKVAELRKLGKGPPKKGEGKRSQQKK
eukprot:CAMPEP_0182441306 /NCGR_PEP_ID=MMETSP1172-20130603/232_1 /TAXON_ID=708627 /ORGANISM="Timspurckia oligopyrenoides, Strain CCMP3278" /LENGTH=145 /DNA_ID=CAMNT_0024635491 /DNA_START=74 /DNA_END=512 /DNA_ORIENTATION=+